MKKPVKLKKLVVVRVVCPEQDVPAFLRKMANFAENNKPIINEENFYEYVGTMGNCEFNYE
jgi:hypothetical protein